MGILWLSQVVRVSKGVDMRFRSTNGNAFDQGIWKMSVAQSRLSLWNPMDCSLPVSSVGGIFQARILKWVAIPFSMESSWLRDRIWVSRIASRFFTIWATREAHLFLTTTLKGRNYYPCLVSQMKKLELREVRRSACTPKLTLAELRFDPKQSDSPACDFNQCVDCLESESEIAQSCSDSLRPPGQ